MDWQLHKKRGGISANGAMELHRAPRHSIRVLSPGNLTQSTATGDVVAFSPDSASYLDRIKLSDGRTHWCDDSEERLTSSYGRSYQRDLATPWSLSSSHGIEFMLGAGLLGSPQLLEERQAQKKKLETETEMVDQHAGETAYFPTGGRGLIGGVGYWGSGILAH
ncbi:hypothetical protein BKA67DRAFT_536050 [Truncatella angustata]|uniref:Uncharacterized protein n=1 Tax=Truncatella angustata TaxID=152316 RepID=A0A9P8UM74_9PEZI|nr:uncharacterized protein BKA67DRAFT_536050 [Truncatella angustata]KAH6654749.1 hypothetical protein BKA67DRAFT_536050 [Truncatella angustata]